MWNPNKKAPNEFLSVLFQNDEDDEDEGEHDISDEEDMVEEWLICDDIDLDVEEEEGDIVQPTPRPRPCQPPWPHRLNEPGISRESEREPHYSDEPRIRRERVKSRSPVHPPPPNESNDQLRNCEASPPAENWDKSADRIKRERVRSRSPVRPPPPNESNDQLRNSEASPPAENWDKSADNWDIMSMPVNIDMAEEMPMREQFDIEEDEFMFADEHELMHERGGVQVTGRVRGSVRGSVRGRARGGRGRRGRGRGGRVAAADSRQIFQAGDPIYEVYINDEDVPADMQEKLQVIVSKRMRRQEDERRRNARRAEAREGEEGAEPVADLFTAEDHVFDWRPMSGYTGAQESFQVEVGPTTHYEDCLSAFLSFWDVSILDHIVTETNRYAEEISRRSAFFRRTWYNTNASEILILFAFWMMLAIIRMPSYDSCFAIDPLLRTYIFRTMFTRRRFWNLSRALHFVDKSTRTPLSDRLFSLGPVIDHLNSKFQANYTPSQNICIDESLTLWKGNLSFRQYIKTKAARFGIKTYELCESVSGYLWSFFVYTGKNLEDPEQDSDALPKSTSSVLRLIRPLLNKGYTLFVDNWFTSPLLARFLKKNRTDVVGTLRSNRANVPPLLAEAKLEDGQYVGRNSGDMTVLAWQDKKKKIVCLSTYHGAEVQFNEAKAWRPAQCKPLLILDYNRHMGGVDRKDQMLEPYLLERKKGCKWYMKLFRRLLNCSILNSRILLAESLNLNVDHVGFRLALVKQIVEAHLPLVPVPRSHDHNSRPEVPLDPIRLDGRDHWASHIPHPGGETTRSHRLRCVWCSERAKKSVKTIYQCRKCEVALCIPGCFEQYHTVR